MPVVGRGHDNRRAQVCIDFFDLDTRGELNLGRAEVIQRLWRELEDRRAGAAATKRGAGEMIETLTCRTALFSGCARAFVHLHAADRARAKTYYTEARRLFVRKEPALSQLVPGPPRRRRPR